jgi:hypothetical protein
MKNFSELLATEPHLTVVLKLKRHGEAFWYGEINGKAIQTYTTYREFGLHDPISIYLKLTTLKGQGGLEIESLTVNGHEVMPKYQHMANNSTSYLSIENEEWELKIDNPFYQWYHQVTGQGWLLTPTPMKIETKL